MPAGNTDLFDQEIPDLLGQGLVVLGIDLLYVIDLFNCLQVHSKPLKAFYAIFFCRSDGGKAPPKIPCHQAGHVATQWPLPKAF